MGGGSAGTARWFDGLGPHPGWLHARLAAVNEVGAGLLMAAGGRRRDRPPGQGVFVFKGGWEYVALIAVISAAVVSTGPGRYSLDAVLGWHLAGPAWAGLAMVAGLAAAAGLYVAATRRPADRLPAAASPADREAVR
jgi:putative oxidoreductase